MTIRTSNTKFFDALGPEPRENIGWEVVVLSHVDFTTVLAYVSEWENLSWTMELNGEGSGSITVDVDAASFQKSASNVDEVLDSPNLWQFYYEGILRHEWLGEKLDESLLDSSEKRRITVSGPGSAAVLKDAIVLPPNFPTVPPYYWTFSEVTQASMWLAWLDAAKARGMLTFVETTFTDLLDGTGDAWVDLSSTQEQNGANLFEKLVQISDILTADWVMRPGFRVDMRMDYGQHVEDEVVFYPLKGQLTRGRNRDREKIKNYVVAQDAYGTVSIDQDGTSMSKWRRRESWVSAGNALEDQSRAAVAAAALAQLKDELREWSLKVDPLLPAPRRIFEDYDLGWWIGVDVDPIKSGSSEEHYMLPLRIVAMAGTVDADGEFDLELTMETLRQSAARRVENAIDKLGGDTATVTAATPISVAAGAAAAVASSTINDLIDVEAGGASSGDTLVWDEGAQEWVAGTPAEGGFKGSWNVGTAYKSGSIVEHVVQGSSVHFGTTVDEPAGNEPGVAGNWIALGGGSGGVGASIYTLGVDTIGGTPTQPSNNVHYAQKITVTEEALMQAIEVYCDNSDGNPNSLGVGLFADNGGTPGIMLAKATERSGDSFYIPAPGTAPWGDPRWLSMSVSKHLTPGDYWIAFYSVDAAGFRIYRDTGAAGSSYSWTSSGAWMSEGYTGLTAQTLVWSMRAVFGAGAQGEPGSIWNYLGEWDSGTTYAADDVVTLGDSSYVAIAESTNQTPPNATYWQVVATSGLAGVLYGTTPPSAPPFTGATSPLFVDTDATYDWSQYGIPGPAGPEGDAFVAVNAQSGTTYSLVLTDVGKMVELGNAAAITLTVPDNATVAFDVGTRIDLMQTGDGTVTVAGAAGVTVESQGALLSFSDKWAAGTLIKRATDSWVLIGSLA